MKSSDDHEATKKLITDNSEKDDNTQNFMKYLNLNFAKFIALILIISFVFYHGYLNSFYGRNSCNRLLGEGHILASKEWQPYGCMIHKYNQHDIKSCFNYIKYYDGFNNFFFIGDFRIRQLYISFVQHLDESYNPSESMILQNQNLTYKNKNLNLEIGYIWKPFIDETLLNLIKSLSLNTNQKPSFLVMGMATNYMWMDGSSQESIDKFQNNLTSLIELIDDINYEYKLVKPTKDKKGYNTTKQSKAIDPKEDNQIISLYWMLQDPVDESKYRFNKTLHDTINNQKN